MISAMSVLSNNWRLLASGAADGAANMALDRALLDEMEAALAAFGIGAFGTAVGSVISALLFSSILGTETWKLAGQFAGTYTGRVEISSTNAFNSPRVVEVMLEVYEPDRDRKTAEQE